MSSPQPAPASPRKVILDCDPGIDDACAIAFACGHPGLDLRGVTTVAGNVGLPRTTANALSVLEFAGFPDVPVAAGSPVPLLRPALDALRVHGESGLGHARLPGGAVGLRGRLPGHGARLRPPRLRVAARGLGRHAALRRALERRPEGQLGDDPLADPDLRRVHHVGAGLHHQRSRRDLRRQPADLPAGPGVEDVPPRRDGHERLVRPPEAAVARRRSLHLGQPGLVPVAGAAAALPVQLRRPGPPERCRRRAAAGAGVSRRPEHLGRGGPGRVPVRRRLPGGGAARHLHHVA